MYNTAGVALRRVRRRAENSAVSLGGGVCTVEGCVITFTDCLVVGNAGSDGGGVYCGPECGTSWVNCTVTRNRATSFVW